MKTSLLSLTRYVGRGSRQFTLCGVKFDIQTHRGHARHLYRVSWFPCWLLNCSWDVSGYDARALRQIVGKMLAHPNEHYLPRLPEVSNPRGPSAWAILHALSVS